MHYQVNTYDGIGAVYWCRTCEQIVNKIDLLNYDNELTEGCVSESMNCEDFDGTPEEYLARLILEESKGGIA